MSAATSLGGSAGFSFCLVVPSSKVCHLGKTKADRSPIDQPQNQAAGRTTHRTLFRRPLTERGERALRRDRISESPPVSEQQSNHQQFRRARLERVRWLGAANPQRVAHDQFLSRSSSCSLDRADPFSGEDDAITVEWIEASTVDDRVECERGHMYLGRNDAQGILDRKAAIVAFVAPIFRDSLVVPSEEFIFDPSNRTFADPHGFGIQALRDESVSRASGYCGDRFAALLADKSRHFRILRFS